MPIDVSRDLQILWFSAGIIAALLAWLQYRANNRWRRADSLAALMKAWRENPINRNAMRMLDTLSIEGRGLRVDFGAEADKYAAPRYVELTPDLILAALWTAAERPDPATVDPQAWGVSQLIRETLEFFLNELSHMNRYIQSGLYPSPLIRPYLRWYVGILGAADQAAPAATRARMKAFLQSWGYEDVLALIARARREGWSRGRGRHER